MVLQKPSKNLYHKLFIYLGPLAFMGNRMIVRLIRQVFPVKTSLLVNNSHVLNKLFIELLDNLEHY